MKIGCIDFAAVHKAASDAAFGCFVFIRFTALVAAVSAIPATTAAQAMESNPSACLAERVGEQP